MGQILGPSFSRADVTGVIEQILGVYLESRVQDETFIQCFRRIGLEPFKVEVYDKAA